MRKNQLESTSDLSRKGFWECFSVRQKNLDGVLQTWRWILLNWWNDQEKVLFHVIHNNIEEEKIPVMGYHLIMNVKVEVMESSDVLKTHKSIISHLFETMISE